MQPGCGSTRGSRDPGGAVEGVAGPQEREAGEAAHQGCRAAKIALAPQAALVSLHGFLRTPTARLAGPAACPIPASPNGYDRGNRSGKPVWTCERANRTLPLSTASTGRCPLRREGARTGSARCSTVRARRPQRRIPGWPNAYRQGRPIPSSPIRAMIADGIVYDSHHHGCSPPRSTGSHAYPWLPPRTPRIRITVVRIPTSGTSRNGRFTGESGSRRVVRRSSNSSRSPQRNAVRSLTEHRAVRRTATEWCSGWRFEDRAPATPAGHAQGSMPRPLRRSIRSRQRGG